MPKVAAETRRPMLAKLLPACILLDVPNAVTTGMRRGELLAFR